MQATTVNHRIPHKGNWQLFCDPTNHESACKHCHDQVIQAEERRGYAKTSALVAQRFGISTVAANENAKAVGLARHEMINLGRQAQDVGTMLAMGASPMQVFTSQFAQIFDIFSSSQGTVKGFFGQMVGGLTSIVTPGRLAFGVIAAGATTAAAAVYSYLSAQQKVAMALTGAGRASGATVGGINDIAKAGSSTFGLSISEAREMASALAATGRIANDNLLPIVQMGKDIAHAFGADANEATKLLTQAFSDPARGADLLNDRLGFLDAAMKRNIENLVAQNRTYEAQKVLMAGVQTGLTGVDDAVSKTTKGWAAAGNAISNAWTRLGEFIASAGNAGPLEEQAESLKKQIASYIPGVEHLGFVAQRTYPHFPQAVQEPRRDNMFWLWSISFLSRSGASRMCRSGSRH